ncbi:MAG: phosphoglycerate kinase [Candidatus Omnitrophota bacterium]|nr:phosphoglycerate kinase [Candidatus Omnitrophota bacterium]
MEKKTIRDIDLKNKKVIIRVDFNVPLDKELRITDDRRIREALPTIQYVLDKSAKKVILMSHLGRPNGRVVENLRLNPVAKRLQELLKEPVKKLDDCVSAEVSSQIDNSKERVLLLENLRFYPEEEKNDPEFAKKLASLADIFVFDAFGSAHRAHASTEGIARYLPSVSGFLLEKEITYLGKALEKPLKPFMLILGGAKVSDKIGVIENLLAKVDAILIGGGMAYTFLKAQGFKIGNSKLEADKVEAAKEILEKAKKARIKIVLPVDHLITQKIDTAANLKIVKDDIPDDWIAVDIGPESIKLFKDSLKNAKTIAWNGPLGICEIDAFAGGTKDVADFIANLKDAVTVIGGGDTAAAMLKFKLEDKLTHISTGGGASLEYMEGKVLPGIACLLDK